jgi:hypothetical protein
METLPEAIKSPLERTLNRNLVKYAASRAIQCPQCWNILNARRTVVTSLRRGDTREEFICCSDCADKLLSSDALAARGIEVLETVDGRELFRTAPRPRTAPRITSDTVAFKIPIGTKDKTVRARPLDVANGALFYEHATPDVALHYGRSAVSRRLYARTVSFANGAACFAGIPVGSGATCAADFWAQLSETDRQALLDFAAGPPTKDAMNNTHLLLSDAARIAFKTCRDAARKVRP